MSRLLEASGRAGYLAATRPLVEAQIRRPLRRAEQAIDVFALTAALDRAKDELHAAINAERRREVRSSIRTGHPIRLTVTRPMLKPLERLYRTGRREARHELAAVGLQPVSARRLEAEPEVPQLARIVARLRAGLGGFSVRLQQAQEATLVELQVTSAGAVADALAAALLNVAGGRALAAGLVSKSLFLGMAETFEENADLVAGWEYTSVLDGGTCDVCAPLDGSSYESLAALFEVLPDFGPNPDCLGGDRCRCRAVPTG